MPTTPTDEQNAHMIKHMEENKFVCGLCCLGFKDVPSLRNHDCVPEEFAPPPDPEEDYSFEALLRAQYPHIPEEQLYKEEPGL